MKVILVTILCTCNYLLTYSQTSKAVLTETKTITYKDGQEVFNICKNNPSIDFNDKFEYYWYNEYSGIKSSKGGTGGNLLHGKYQLFDESGNLIKETNYYFGLYDGLYRTWDDKGDIKETLKFKNGILIYSKRTTENGYIIEIIGEPLKKGTIKKVYTSYNKLVEESTSITWDILHTKTYFEEIELNQLEQEWTHPAGMPDYCLGNYKSYYKNGKLKTIGKFVENQKDSIWTFYNEDGSISSSFKYRIANEKSENGKLKSKGSEYFDKITQGWIKDGKWIYFKENGVDYEKIVEYEAGEIIKSN